MDRGIVIRRRREPDGASVSPAAHIARRLAYALTWHTLLHSTPTRVTAVPTSCGPKGLKGPVEPRSRCADGAERPADQIAFTTHRSGPGFAPRCASYPGSPSSMSDNPHSRTIVEPVSDHRGAVRGVGQAAPEMYLHSERVDQLRELTVDDRAFEGEIARSQVIVRSAVNVWVPPCRTPWDEDH